MAFVDALYHGTAELEGLLAKRARSLCDLPYMLRCRRAVPVVDAPLEKVVAKVQPQVVVDARMRKHEEPEAQRGLAPLTIGLGPNFEAGKNVDLAVETAWGDELGTVIRAGRTRALAGEPMPIEGHARDRYVYAPMAGVFATQCNIGDSVVQGQEVARIDGIVIYAPLSGCLRGITHDGAPVRHGAKILEVDPRGDPRAVRGLGERPRRIAEGVLQAVNDAALAKLGRHGAPFGIAAAIAALGGLIGLGGAEFRLPALVGVFKFGVRQAIIMNVVISIATVLASLVFRVGMHGAAPVLTHLDAFGALVTGSLAGAFAGSALVNRLDTHSLHRAIGALLAMLAVVMAAHGFMPHTGAPLTESGGLLFALGTATGVAIGLVGSMLGVAGGELLIPTLVLLYGLDVKSAGTVSLAVSLPMLLITIWRLWHLPAARVVSSERSFATAMVLGSFLGAFIGSSLAGIAPEQILSVALAVILFVSARKAFAR
jgi:xanthine dehydrogenase accessory factor